ncbi:lipoprotein insertase outer membrane protein LolB [Pseudothauera lacus]|uniref:Outer-membrane lipoprotein LolB n=1 Tax=Pseudothauera lacus TaxID=2136175 RepID=A0A2T4IBG6_9RHOO|nr:lipoprotein insertase outer membrane protein LolB [Pseudothauera lacus]PTD95119.1 outer membrane lipoprotein LolB [Pseudothauera lacus]
MHPALLHKLAQRCALAALCAATLAACAGMSTRDEVAAAERLQVPHFELDGRLSASAGERAASGQLSWEQRSDGARWTVYTPLGQIAARVDQDARGAVLTQADGRQYHAASAAELLPAVLGIEVPVDRLAGWVQATPHAAAEVRQRDASGRPLVVIDSGWRIDYPAYASPAPDAPPRRILVQRGDAQLRLVIDEWRPAP